MHRRERASWPPLPSPALTYRLSLAALVVATVAIRIGWTIGRAHRTYDDGAYLASTDAVSAGADPFRDVFSSQGPLWLPTLRLAQVLGGGASWAPRLAVLGAGVAVVLAAAGVARRTVGTTGALVAAGLVATSGTLVFTTSTLESDSLAAAFAGGALFGVVAARRSWTAALAVGALGAAALGTKSLVVVPVVGLAWCLLTRWHGWRAAALAVGVGGVVGLAVVLPWGPANVWDQYVQFHVDARAPLTPGANLDAVWDRLWRYDRLLLGAAVGGVAWWWLRGRRSAGPHADDGRAADLRRWLWLALAASLVVLAWDSPLQLQHSTLLVLPLALLAAGHRVPVVAVVVVAALVLPGQAERSSWRWSANEAVGPEAAIVDTLRRIEPAGALVLADEPGLAWQADRRIPPSLVDPSFVRIDTGYLTTDEVLDAAEAPDVCAVLFWSGRFAVLVGLERALTAAGYEAVTADGPHRLYLRDGCQLAG